MRRRSIRFRPINRVRQRFRYKQEDSPLVIDVQSDLPLARKGFFRRAVDRCLRAKAEYSAGQASGISSRATLRFSWCKSN